MSPYTPRGKNVLRSWICARSDGDTYGKLIVFTGDAAGQVEAGLLEGVGEGDFEQVLLTLEAALNRYRALQGEGRFREAGEELEKIYRMVEMLVAGE